MADDNNMDIQNTCKIISLLLDYPDQTLKDNLGNIILHIKEDKELSEEDRMQFNSFMDYAEGFASLLDWQESYVGLFDTSTKTNLYLFDYVYGSSKDRGQAMVDLKEMYMKSGMVPNENELPDYLPQFLEFVSSLETEEAGKSLAEILPILKQMVKRFERDSHPYLPLIKILCNLSTQKQ